MLTHGELNMTYWTEYYKKNAEKIKERQKNRAKFFQGIAEAMADQWG